MCRKCISLLVLLNSVFYLTGCSRMRYISLEKLSEVEQESNVWVTMADGSKYELKEPKVEDSKLVGYIDPEGYREIDTSEIESLGVQDQDRTTTIALAMFGIAGAIIFIAVMSDNSGGSGSCST